MVATHEPLWLTSSLLETVRADSAAQPGHRPDSSIGGSYACPALTVAVRCRPRLPHRLLPGVLGLCSRRAASAPLQCLSCACAGVMSRCSASCVLCSWLSRSCFASVCGFAVVEHTHT